MKSKPYNYKGKVYRYDDERCVVECIAKATDEEVEEESNWKERWGRSILSIDETGYYTVNTADLSSDAWRNIKTRNAYLAEYGAFIDDEARYLSESFIKNDLSMLKPEYLRREEA